MPKKLTTQEFINKSKNIHTKEWDYSKVNYINNRTKVEIGCPIHGYFLQSPMDHLVGKGCKKCSDEFRRDTFEEFKEKALLKHNGFYEYPHDDYENSYSKIKIKCPNHDIFQQEAYSHLRGQGCPKCKGDKNAERKLRNSSDVLQQLYKVHNNKYKYPNFEYKGSRFKIDIECNENGIFRQTIGQHLLGRGCPKCSNYVSNPEIELQEFVKSLTFKVQTSNRKIISPYELDIYIPKLQKAIEFNGTWWHYNYENPRCKPKGYHAMKSNLCKQQNIKLLHIREDLWNKDKEKMKTIIKKFLTNGNSVE